MGEGQGAGDKLSGQTGLGDGDYGSLMLQRTCPFSCRNWAILGKKINLCDSSLFKATRIQLRKCIFIDCRVEILAVGLLTDSVYGLHSYEG